MSAGLSAWADSYLVLRRSSGYQLQEVEYHIRSFISWLGQDNPDRDGFTAEEAIRWACQPGLQPRTHAKRLRSVGGWAAYARAHGADAPVIPAGSLPADQTRPTPYIYRDGQVRAVMDVFARRAKTGRTWRSRWKDTTFEALTGLLACTGMRIGEAIALDRQDVDMDTGWVNITTGKTGRERLVLLHPTALTELAAYFGDPRRPAAADPDPAFVSSFGRRVEYTVYQIGFRAAVAEAGLEPQGQAKPVIHSLRHSFAVGQLAGAYRDGADPARRLTLLAVWLGHVSPKSSYWYLTATQELLGAAADLLEQQVTP